MVLRRISLPGLYSLFCFGYLYGGSYVVTTTDPSGPGSLAEAVTSANSDPGSTITFNSMIMGGTIALEDPLLITSNCTVDGGSNDITISGGMPAIVRPFFINENLTSVVISNLTIINGLAQGGAGGAALLNGGGGGGGGGFGGGCLVDSVATFTDVSFQNNQAIGGAGGSASSGGGSWGGGGGGGLGGDGGEGNEAYGAGGGGELSNQPGQDSASASGPSGQALGGGTAGGNGGGYPPPSFQDLGLPGNPGNRFGGGGGGSRTNNTNPTNGGAGGYGGGGGGAGAVVESAEVNRGGGNGGVGGGGGGAPSNTLSPSSVQATSIFGGGLGGFEGGHSEVAQPGGGGAGLGGALFVSNQSTTTLAYTTSGAASSAFSGNTVQGGDAGIAISGATDATGGSSLGTDIFVDQGGTLAFNLSSGVTLQPTTSSLASNTNGLFNLQNNGPGTLDLSGVTAPLFAANIGVNAGVVHITLDANLGTAASTLAFDGGTLDVNGTFSSNRAITLNSGNGTIQVTGAWTELSPFTGSGGFTKAGAGTLLLSSVNTYSGQTTVGAGTLALTGSGSISSSEAVTVDGTFDISGLDGSSTTIKSLSGSGIVNLGARRLTVNTSLAATTTFSGQLTGTGGSFTKSGSSYTLNLTGTTSNYTGNTTVAAGILSAGAVQALSPSSAVILSGGTLSLNGFNQSIPTLSGNSGIVDLGASSGTLTLTSASSNASPYRGTIINAGNLTLAGSGVFRLTGTNNTYSGTTTINSGTLRVGANNALSPNSAIIMGGGILDLNGFSVTIPELSGNGAITFSTLINPNTLTINGNPVTNPLIFSGSIKGRGNLTISLTDGKTFQLAGTNNTYRGRTTVNSGTLQTGAANALSSSSRVVMANAMGAVLDLNEFPNEIFSLSGGGSSGGNVTLGSTTNGVLTIGGNETTTYTGEISGNGGFIQQGTGTTILIGANTYTGPTTINAGTLVVGVGGVGSLTGSDVTVNSGGVLKGTGTISESVTVENGGTISGGNSIGTISLGSLTLLSGSNLTLEISDTGASTIYQITSNAELAGNLAVTVDRGIYEAGTTYTFITTGPAGRMGTFDSFTSNTQGTSALSGTLNYGSNFVQLLLTEPIYALIPTTGLQRNAEALADYLNRFAADPAVQPALLAIGALPPDEAEAALSSVSPARNAISTWTAQNTLFGINGVAINRMLQQRYMRGIETNQPAFASLVEEELTASLSFSNPYGKAQTATKKKNRYAVWAEGFGFFARQKARSENPTFHSATGCGLVGLDAYDFKYGQIGAALGYAQSSISESGTGSGSIQTYVTGIYGTAYIQKDAYVELGLWGAFDQFHNKRNVVYPGFSAVAKSNHHGWQLAPHLGVGYDVNFCWGTLEPFASFDAAVLFQNGYSEHGAGVLNMAVHSSTSWLLQTEAGLNVYQVKHCKPGYLIFRETLSYKNLAPFAVGTLSGTSLVGYPPGFTVTSFRDNLNMISPGFEIFFKCENNGYFISLAYEGEFTIGSGGYMSNEGIAKIGGFF